MKKLVTAFLGLLLIISCAEKKQNENFQDEEARLADIREKMYNEVMAVHDEVMPKMDEIYRLKSKLQDELKSLLEQADSLNEDRIHTLTEKINELESAGNGMMVWMRQFTTVPDSLGHEAIMQGLQEEKRKIEEVKKDMLEAIQKAKDEN